MLKRPMLAAKTTDADLYKLPFPMLASPKIDGVRALVRDGQVVSRSMKPIPNKFVQFMLGHTAFNGLDGELVIGGATNPRLMRDTVSGVMTHEGEPDFQYHVFDFWDAPLPYFERLLKLEDYTFHNRIVLVPHTRIESISQLKQYETEQLDRGYEGIVLRAFNNPYKQGRSTLRERGMLKIKKFSDSEAEIIDWEPLQRNLNASMPNEIGLTSRSTHQGNKVDDELLGSLTVRDIHTGVVFEIGSGFTELERQELWEVRTSLKGKLIKYKFFAVGVKDKPRFPIYLGFRSTLDL